MSRSRCAGSPTHAVTSVGVCWEIREYGLSYYVLCTPNRVVWSRRVDFVVVARSVMREWHRAAGAGVWRGSCGSCVWLYLRLSSRYAHPLPHRRLQLHRLQPHHCLLTLRRQRPLPCHLLPRRQPPPRMPPRRHRPPLHRLPLRRRRSLHRPPRSPRASTSTVPARIVAAALAACGTPALGRTHAAAPLARCRRRQ